MRTLLEISDTLEGCRPRDPRSGGCEGEVGAAEGFCRLLYRTKGMRTLGREDKAQALEKRLKTRI